MAIISWMSHFDGLHLQSVISPHESKLHQLQCQEDLSFMSGIITCDENWVSVCSSETKQQFSVKTETQCASLKVKHQVRGVSRSLLAILFWLSQHTKTLLPRVRLSWQNYTIMSSGVWKITSIANQLNCACATVPQHTAQPSLTTSSTRCSL